MANWTQEDGAPKPVTNPADVSTIAQISRGNVAGGVSAPVPCLIPSFADAVKLLSARYSCLVLDSHRRHIALPPQYLRKKRTGIQEELNAELLKFSSSLKGVPMAYDNIKVVGQHGDIHDDRGFIHFNIEASFVVFKPKKGSKGHVLCMIMRFRIPIRSQNSILVLIWIKSLICAVQNVLVRLGDKCVVTNNNLLIFRVQELVVQTEQKESTVESTTEPESTEDTIDSPKPKKKKKKDKCEKESQNDRGLEQTSENHQTAADTAEIDSNANRHHKEKKRKKKERQESDEILPSELSTSDSSRYVNDKTSRKRAAESNDGPQDAPAAKKKKKSK
uniref:DNA-directed RNA polymerase subunit n=1 Tax=Sinocyclocheilus rhinocerous TaxID=307959 RepID=A0A673HDF1_9TELE